MTGIKIASGVALFSGGSAMLAQLASPKDLIGLGAEQLLALVALSAIAALVYFVCKFIPALLALADKVGSLVAKMEDRPCIAQGCDKAHDKQGK
jgi:CBS domain containing-hemolysin-like protein